MSRLCSIDGCGCPVRSRGWCSRHYYRWRMHGDPLSGRIPSGTLAEWIDDVALRYEGDDCLIWPFSRNNKGYGQIRQNGRTEIVSRLVCIEVNGPPPTTDHEAAHSCGKGHLGCVTKRHLSWKTAKENKADDLMHGTRSIGVRNGRAKLSQREVLEIRRICADGLSSQGDIARQFGVTQTAVSRVHKRQRWAHIQDGE